jgi:hypothetical protein
MRRRAFTDTCSARSATQKRQRRRNNSPSTVAESVYSSCLTKPRALVTQPGTHGSSCVKSITTVCASTLVLVVRVLIDKSSYKLLAHGG